MDPRRLEVRDRAILLLLAVYGLRSIEVRKLKLDDVEWQRDLSLSFGSVVRGTVVAGVVWRHRFTGGLTRRGAILTRPQ